eukprot:scaffold6730_cov66-Cyclotella_meneghiniana.AAC.8
METIRKRWRNSNILSIQGTKSNHDKKGDNLGSLEQTLPSATRWLTIVFKAIWTQVKLKLRRPSKQGCFLAFQTGLHFLI